MKPIFKRTGPIRNSEDSEGLRLLLLALAAAVLFHGGLLPFTHSNTYDAFIHMFFSDSYHRSWFDPWEPRWYTGFATTSYPPGTHMMIAGLMYLFPLRVAFVIVQLVGILLLTVGVYRFSRLWVTSRPAGYAAVFLVLSSSVSETVHLFGQLPTIFSLGVFLNGLPYVYRWLVGGRLSDFGAAIVFTAATTAAHHVTTIFGGVLFILPLGLQALRAVVEINKPNSRKAWAIVFLAPLGRGFLLAIFMAAVILLTVYPYWSWSINDPITQVPIPHGSRENFLERLDLGFVFFLLPWGTALLALPYVIWKTATTRLWPLGIAVLLCFILGTGGTTPISRAILRGAFDILTLDRFTFWASILILPFLGYLFDGLLHGRSGEAIRAALGRGIHRTLVGGYFLATVSIAVFAAILPTIQPTQPRFIDPTPIVEFLEEDEHNRWRYLTLGFGDQFAYLSAQTTALSVDGNYHSARRLPDLTRFSVERLENAKYLGVPGLGSLQQFLINADRYNLKYVFSNDEFYDPILHFSGWNRLNRLANGVMVWEKPDVTPLPAFTPRRDIPNSHMLMWGLLPPIALAIAALIFVVSILHQSFAQSSKDLRPITARVSGFQKPKRVRMAVITLTAVFSVVVVGLGAFTLHRNSTPATPEETITAYFNDLDFRRFRAAYSRLDPETRPDFEEVMFAWKWRGGLIASYGKLTDIQIEENSLGGNLADWAVELNWLTAIDLQVETKSIRTVQRSGQWYIAPIDLRPTQTPSRLQRSADVAWNVVGRRQPRIETDLHRDLLDRPRVSPHGMRLVENGGRFSVIGAVTNSDADPAAVSLFADLVSSELIMARNAAGIVLGQRLLPHESTGFRIDFDGVLSLQSETPSAQFDPTMFIPPELPAPPETAFFEARALVAAKDFYRGVALNGISVHSIGSAPVIEGLAVNVGTETATIVRIVSLLFDTDGNPIWADAQFVDTNLFPGQSVDFKISLPARADIRIISDVAPEKVIVNGSVSQAQFESSNAVIGSIPIDIPGFSALQLHVSSMTYDPLL